MKLEYMILGILKINPRTGYDMKKYLDTEGRFGRARAPLSQIYTTLLQPRTPMAHEIAKTANP